MSTSKYSVSVKDFVVGKRSGHEVFMCLRVDKKVSTDDESLIRRQSIHP